MLVACLIGFFLAFAGSMPTAGPTGVLVLTWGLGGRYDKGVAVAVGAALPEAAYASFAFLGFSAVLQRYAWVEPVSQVLAVLILVVFGAVLLSGRVGNTSPAADAKSAGRAVDGPLGAFGVGFGIAALNPAFIANWSIVVAMAHASLGFDLHPDHVAGFALGVVAGIVAWFGLVLWLLARHGHRFNPQARARALRYVGGLLLVLALLLAGRAATVALA